MALNDSTNLQSEEWRSVVGYEGVYEVSSLGRVRRVGKAHGATFWHILVQRLGYGGYPTLTLTFNCKAKKCYVHRLVALAFIGPCPEGKEVNHKDRNRLNPSVENLEYVTRSENGKHAYQNGAVSKKGTEKLSAKLTEQDVMAIRTSIDTSRSLARHYGVCHSTILAIRNRKKWKHIA